MESVQTPSSVKISLFVQERRYQCRVRVKMHLWGRGWRCMARWTTVEEGSSSDGNEWQFSLFFQESWWYATRQSPTPVTILSSGRGSSHQSCILEPSIQSPPNNYCKPIPSKSLINTAICARFAASATKLKSTEKVKSHLGWWIFEVQVVRQVVEGRKLVHWRWRWTGRRYSTR